ncbi:MAG: diguanylate cyclase [Actinomycetia bacterium]|nr:diguanylate cyclase [Actinomycetes bacterium]MCH9710454.1 diguanylate cyclase [Actinomycetes bacterium]MCH9767378.1 diguanylate cyclase [Actinomycetes bacterium]
MRPSHSDVLLDAVIDRGIIELDSTGAVVHWSAGAQALFGYSEVEILGRPVSVLHTDGDRATGTAERELAAAIESDRVEFDSWRVRKGGLPFRTGVTLRAIRDQAGSVTGFVEVVKDVTADEQLGHAMFHELLEAAPDATVIVGPDGRITLANAQTDRMFGYPREDLIGSAVEMLLPPRLRGKHGEYRAGFLADPVLRPMGAGLDLWGMRRDGTEFPVDISLSPLHIAQTSQVWATIRDVTERHECQEQLRRQKDALIETQRKLERLAFTDTLTGLLNHAETMTRLEAALTNPRAPGAHLGVLFCDADRFKAINDDWGHTVGDAVLSAMAERIRGCLRDGDTVGRVGGDEMLVLLPGLHSLEEAVQIADKVRCRVAEPIHSRGRTIQATVSIGATLALPGESVDAMTARADAAMYKAKRAGRNTVNAI